MHLLKLCLYTAAWRGWAWFRGILPDELHGFLLLGDKLAQLLLQHPCILLMSCRWRHSVSGSWDLDMHEADHVTTQRAAQVTCRQTAGVGSRWQQRALWPLWRIRCLILPSCNGALGEAWATVLLSASQALLKCRAVRFALTMHRQAAAWQQVCPAGVLAQQGRQIFSLRVWRK